MSEQNVEIVRRALHGFENDAEAMLDVFDEELEWFPFEDSHSRSVGHEGALRIRQRWLEAWDEHRIDVEEMLDGGDDVVVSMRLRGRGNLSGAEVDVRLHVHYKLREGKIVRIYEHLDRAEALEAAGLSE